jgi:hypothetical protein
MGCRLVIEFIALLQLVTTINYIVIVDSHTLQFTTACNKSSQSALFAPAVAW